MTTTTRFRVRWDRIAAAIALGLTLAVMAWWGLSIASERADPWHGAPVCTDEIADAGGICHGEPK